MGQLRNDDREKTKRKGHSAWFQTKRSNRNQAKGELPFHRTHQGMVLTFLFPQLPLMLILIQKQKGKLVTFCDTVSL